MWYPFHFLSTQLKSLPYPDANFQSKTVIVTGANVGLGKEAARHFCRLGAAKVILACRDVDKGRAVQADIEASTSRSGVVEVWQIDLGSFQSVKDFCHRVEVELERVGRCRWECWGCHRHVRWVRRWIWEQHRHQRRVDILDGLLVASKIAQNSHEVQRRAETGCGLLGCSHICKDHTQKLTALKHRAICTDYPRPNFQRGQKQ